MRQHFLPAASRPWALALCAVGALFGSPLASAQGSTGLADAQSAFQRERATCLNGASHQDRATCLREASAAYQEVRRGQLGNGDGQFERNRLIRCNVQSPQDRLACERNANGEGVTSGSVNGGGIIREITTTVTN